MDAYRLVYYSVVAGLICCVPLVVLAIVYRDRGVFTRSRADLATKRGAWPLIGNLFDVLGNNRQLEMWLRDTSTQYARDPTKAHSVTVPFVRIIDITRPDLIHHVQTTNFANYKKGEMFHANFEQLLGDGIFNVDGHDWYVARKTTSKIFTGANFRGIISTCLEEGIDKLVAIIKRYAKTGQPFDLQELFFRFTLDTFCKMSFGFDVGALSLDSAAPVPFAQAFDRVQVLINKRFNKSVHLPLIRSTSLIQQVVPSPFWKWSEWLDGTDKVIRDNIKIMDDWAYGIIDERQRRGTHTIVGEKSDAVDLLSLYMALRDENGQALNRKGLRDALVCLTGRAWYRNF